MNKLLQSFLCASLLFVATSALKADDCCNDTTDCCDCSCTSIFVPRSAGDDLRRQAVYRNFRPNAEVNDDCCGSGVASIDFRFQRSRHGGDIARSLFGSNVLLFQGSDFTATSATVRNPLALLADNFGLSSATNQQIGFCPRVTNNIIDLELYWQLNSLCDGLFVQFNAPIVKSKFRLRAFDGAGLTVAANNCDNDCNNDCNNDCSNDCNSICGQPALPAPATTAFCAGLMGDALVLPIGGTVALHTIATAPSIESALSGGFLFGNMQTPWTAGRFNLGCDSEDTKLASFNMILGYNAWVCDDYNVGIFLRAAAPTGTDSDCCDCCDGLGVFSNQIGDNHWKLGGGLTGRYDIYNCNDDHFVTIYAEGYAEHLFNRCQVRSFDLLGKGCLSRYMLLKEFNVDADGVATANGNLINAINYTTRNVRTNINVQGEVQVELGYQNNCGFSAGLGWNLYGRGSESGCTIGNACDQSLTGRHFGIKGCTQVEDVCINVINAGSVASATALVTTPAVFTANLINATASASTVTSCGAVDTSAVITTGTTFPVGTSTVCINPCGATLPLAGQTVSLLNTPAGSVTINGVVDTLAVTSTTPVLLTDADLDINSGLLRSQLTNKVFGHIDYEWDNCDYAPKVYLGGEVEFASNSNCGGMNAWAVFLGGSIDF